MTWKKLWEMLSAGFGLFAACLAFLSANALNVFQKAQAAKPFDDLSGAISSAQYWGLWAAVLAFGAAAFRVAATITDK